MNFKSLKGNELIEDLKSIDWYRAFNLNQNETNKSFKLFSNIFETLLDTCAPLKKLSTSEVKLLLKPWITHGIMTSIKAWITHGNMTSIKPWITHGNMTSIKPWITHGNMMSIKSKDKFYKKLLKGNKRKGYTTNSKDIETA